MSISLSRSGLPCGGEWWRRGTLRSLQGMKMGVGFVYRVALSSPSGWKTLVFVFFFWVVRTQGCLPNGLATKPLDCNSFSVD